MSLKLARFNHRLWSASEKISHRLIMGKTMSSNFLYMLFFIRSFFILAGSNDIHKSLDEFEMRSDHGLQS